MPQPRPSTAHAEPGRRPPRYLTGYGLVEAPLDECVERLTRSVGSAGRFDELAADPDVDDPARATREEAVAYLDVLTHPATRRTLLAVNERWTAVLNNHRDGSDFNDDQRLFSELCQARTCRVVDAPDVTRTVRGFQVRQSYPARIFELQGPDGDTTRSVTCALDGSRWVFETYGNPLPIEADFPYSARRRPDRFTSEHLRRLVASIGASPPVPDAFDTASRFVLTSIPMSDERAIEVCTPDEADDPAYGYFRRGLGWVPHMRTHAESVVRDVTLAILLDPAREPEARPYLRAARKQLGRKAFKQITSDVERNVR